MMRQGYLGSLLHGVLFSIQDNYKRSSGANQILRPTSHAAFLNVIPYAK